MLEKGDKVAIWGTGSVAIKVYYLYCRDYEVVCFFDNNKAKQGAEFYGLPVKKFNGDKDIKIIIASSFWKEITKDLIKMNLEIMQDFIPYVFLKPKSVLYYDLCDLGEENALNVLRSLKKSRKAVVIYGNCQTQRLRKIMLMHKPFYEKYFFIEIMPVFTYISNKEKQEQWHILLNDLAFWKEIDLFIYQKVLETNRFYCGLATKHILGMLSESCQTIQILNIYFTGYFIQAKRNEHNIMQEVHQSGLFFYCDKYVDEMIEKGLSENEIINEISRVDFIEPKQVYDAVKKSFEQMREREKEADVGITDFVEQYYDKQQLFYSFNHPTNFVLFEYAKRILKYLDLGDLEIDENAAYILADTLRGVDIPIYPAVLNALKLNGGVNQYFVNRYIDTNLFLNFEEYYREYISCCRIKN